jgi:hypothetical protein
MIDNDSCRENTGDRSNSGAVSAGSCTDATSASEKNRESTIALT